MPPPPPPPPPPPLPPPPSFPGAGLATSGLGRIQSMQHLFWQTSLAMGTESPEKVTTNFINALRSTGPLVNTLITLTVPWTMLAAALYRYEFIYWTLANAKSYLESYFYATVSIPVAHQLHGKVLQWMMGELPQYYVRSQALVAPDQNQAHTYLGERRRRGRPHHYHHQFQEAEEEVPDESLLFLPAAGAYAVYFNGYRMTLERVQTDGNGYYFARDQPQPGLVISCLSLWAGVQPIKEFLDFVEAEAVAARENFTTIYRPVPAPSLGWDGGVSRPSRTLDAVTLDAGLKEALIRDVEAYLHPKTKRYYANRGIPWRRGYLFWGPPGTGKTSLATALAGHFDLNVYMVSLSSQTLNDHGLDTLFTQLPQKCIVLLEDIDSAGVRRETMAAPATEKRRRRAVMPPLAVWEDGPLAMHDAEPDGVTLSGLLNCLDGVRAAEGRVLIMTTNNPESLDAALIRRGRIDQKVYFGCASRETSVKLFMQIFCKTAEELLEDEEAQSAVVVAGLAEAFAASFAENAFTPAEVQGFLIDQRADPEKAVERAGEYFAQMSRNKFAGLNVSVVQGAGGVGDDCVAACVREGEASTRDLVIEDRRDEDLGAEDEDSDDQTTVSEDQSAKDQTTKSEDNDDAQAARRDSVPAGMLTPESDHDSGEEKTPRDVSTPSLTGR
ncbi:hypothetical protein LTR62_002852 [Meristemomyces frigidus]|uniref:Uncharacterized protein n=1 Tax=Meristemomyces frigidus TaxID=1508187 RepID=A0AAN7YJR8_9PEZI|nr:hypothetical protein LTR62_002852 [Meristemomyces frigidus]